MGTGTVHKRVNITLPEETLRMIQRVAGDGNRSQFLNAAAQYYVREKSRASLRKRMIEGYKKQAEFDKVLAEEWFPVEEETWRHSQDR